MQCTMDVFKDVLNIMEKWSVSTKCNGEQNGGTAAHTVTLLRNPSNRDNAGISDKHFLVRYTELTPTPLNTQVSHYLVIQLTSAQAGDKLITS